MNKNNTDIKPRIGRHYTYKEHEYIVIGLPMVKVDNGEWKSGVLYERVVKVGEQANKTYVRQADNFLSRFVPVSLEVGDIVEAVSMGKSKGFLTVESIDYNSDFGVKFKGSELRAKKWIDPITLKVEVEKPEQVTEYAYARPSHAISIPTEEIKKVLDDWKRTLDGNGTCNAAVQIQIIDKIKKIQEIISS